jgi:hypothetical protein
MDIAEYTALLDKNTLDALSWAWSASEDDLHAPVENKWSGIQLLEHITLVDSSVIRRLQSASEAPAEEIVPAGAERLHRIIVTLRNRKVEAPEALHPRGSLKTVEEFEAKFTAQREQLKTELKDGSIKMSNKALAHVILGDITISDWLLFMIYHAERHLEQLRERQPA